MGKNMLSLSSWRIGKGHLNQDGWHFYLAVAIGFSHESVSYLKTLINLDQELLQMEIRKFWTVSDGGFQVYNSYVR